MFPHKKTRCTHVLDIAFHFDKQLQHNAEDKYRIHTYKHMQGHFGFPPRI